MKPIIIAFLLFVGLVACEESPRNVSKDHKATTDFIAKPKDSVTTTYWYNYRNVDTAAKEQTGIFEADKNDYKRGDYVKTSDDNIIEIISEPHLITP